MLCQSRVFLLLLRSDAHLGNLGSSICFWVVIDTCQAKNVARNFSIRIWLRHKRKSRQIAMGLFPRVDLHLKKHHNKADSLLIGEYGRRYQKMRSHEKGLVYIKKLNEKGFTDEDIIAKTHFHVAGITTSKDWHHPNDKEIRKLRSLLILNTEQQRKDALEVWYAPRDAERMDETPKPEPKARAFTDKQIEVLKLLEKGPRLL